MDMKYINYQCGCFARLFLISLGVQLGAFDFQHITRSSVISLLVGAAEVAYRHFVPGVDPRTAAEIPAPAEPPAVQ